MTGTVAALDERRYSSDLFLRESSQLRKYALPSSISLHKNICRSLPRAELLSYEFSLRRSQPGNKSSLAVDTDVNLIGLHHLVAQIARLDHSKETRPINDSSVSVDDNPVVGKKSPNRFSIVFDNRLGEFLFEFQEFFFHIAPFLLSEAEARHCNGRRDESKGLFHKLGLIL
jgi:hypothetical protein